jgi:hypothetical protein
MMADVGFDPLRPGADVEPEHVVAGRRRPLCLPRA